jgi:amino acid adenylation domain-containing protein
MSWHAADTDSTIPARFERQARLHPTKTAIDGTAWAPTFAELDAAANRLAHTLSERGAGTRTRIALLLSHDSPLIAAMLATLKTGAAALVLNASDPPERLARLRADTAPTLIVSDHEHVALALRAGFAEDRIVIQETRPDSSPHPPPADGVRPDDLALLICTSGSTGRPVAVMQTHRNVLHNVLRHTNGLGLRGDDRFVLLASPSGGQGTGTVWTALLNGATLCPFPVHERGLTGLESWLEQHAVTVLVASASLFRHFVATLDGVSLPHVRLVRLGSETALRSDFELWRRRFSPTCAFANIYSSSETGSIAHQLMRADDEPAHARLSAGHPASDMEVVVVGEDGLELGAGEVGEIVVRSRYISSGYWGEPELDASRLSVEQGGVRSFHTRDLGCREEDGRLSLHGRGDDLVKIRGNRVSLSDVQTALSSNVAVASAAVRASDSPDGETRLTAFVVPTPGSRPTAGELREQLREWLPDHSVPSTFLALEQLPLTPHGKVDRERLAQLESTAPALADSDSNPDSDPHVVDMPGSELEELIATLCARVLDRAHVSLEQDFFALGGDSLAAAEVAIGIERALGVKVSMRDFARRATAAGLAHTIRELRAMAAGEQEPALEHSSGIEPLPASPAQERIWRLCMLPGAGQGYTIATSSRIRGPLHPRALERAIEHLLHRHEALRMTFSERAGELVQIVAPPSPFELELLDVSTHADPHAEATSLLRELAGSAFDLEAGPLLRLRLVRLAADEHELHRVEHHIVADGTSWRVFLDELAKLYEAFVRDDPAPLSTELPVRYGDVAAWERRRVRPGGQRHRDLLARWGQLAAYEATPPPFARPAQLGDVAASEGVIEWGLPASVTGGLEHVGRETGATFYMVRLALFAALLSAETQQQELVLGTYVGTRRLPETRAMLGCFTYLAPLRLHAPGDCSVGAWLTTVREAVLEVNDIADLPYEIVAEQLSETGVTLPGIQTLFALRERQPQRRFGGLEMASPVHSLEHYMPSGFSFLVDRSDELGGCRATFDATIYDPNLVRAFIDRYRRLADELCGSPERPLRELVQSVH